MLVLNASGIILGDKKVNNWFEGKIEKKKTFTNINSFPTSERSRVEIMMIFHAK